MTRRSIILQSIILIIFYSITIILYSIITSAQEATFYNKEYLKIDADISSTITIQKTGSNPYVQYVITDLFFHPINDLRLDIISIHTTPESESADSRLRFTWLAPKDNSLTFSVSSILKSKTIESPIVGKVPYPIPYTPPEAAAYLFETATADFNDPSILELANNLSQDEDDLFLLTTKVAAWVRNSISYNLSTVTSKATKPASWVLEKRQGVCDELTNLFIAIMRSQGIPARFISGLAYTDSPSFPEKWGGHGWAEVYFPGYGWIPFDTTYGQFGWLDPSHIKLKVGADATEASTTYEWRGQHITLGIHPLVMRADIIEEGPLINIPFSISVKPARQNVGIGSANVVIATITNKDNRYHAIDLSLGSTDGLHAIGPTRHEIALRPFEKKNVYWTVEVRQDLSPQFLYTFPIVVYNQRGINATSSFNASTRDPIINREDAFIMSHGEEDETKTGIQISCRPSTTTPRQHQSFDATCRILSPPGTPIKTGLLCAEGTCIKPVGTEASLSITKDTPGRQETIVTFVLEDSRVYTTISYTVLDTPTMIIHNASAPPYVGYDDSFNVSITIQQRSLASPVNPTLTASIPGLTKTWPVPPTPESLFTIQMKGADIAGIEGINISLTYEGESGIPVHEQQFVTIYVSEISAWQSLKMAFTRFNFWLHDLLTTKQ